MKRVRHMVEYLGLRVALFILDRLPPSASERLAVGLADAGFFLNPFRRRIAVANVLRSGIAATPRHAAQIARRSYRHFAVLIVESLQSARWLDERTWREHVVLDIPQETMALLQQPGQGVIMVSGHLGNWDVSAHVLSFLKPVVGVASNMNNPYADRFMKRRLPGKRFRLAPKHGPDATRLLSALKNGEILGLLIDQHARHRGMMVDFFGVPASTHTSAALLHLITRTPLCFSYCLRTGPMRFTLKALRPFLWTPTGNREKDVRAILETLNRELEKAIRECPEQYLWAHRRWHALTSAPPATRGIGVRP